MTHLQSRTLLSIVAGTAVLLMRAAHRFVVNLERPKDRLHARAFYTAVSCYVNALHALLTAMRHDNRQRYLSTRTGFHGFVQFKLAKTKSKITTVLDVFVYHMQVFQFSCDEDWNIFPARLLFYERNGTAHIEKVHFITRKRRTIERNSDWRGELSQISVSPHATRLRSKPHQDAACLSGCVKNCNIVQ